MIPIFPGGLRGWTEMLYGEADVRDARILNPIYLVSTWEKSGRRLSKPRRGSVRHGAAPLP
jgi:hypothetical protein